MRFLHTIATTLTGWIEAMIPSPPGFVTEMSSGISSVLALIPGPVLNFVPLVPVLAAVGVTYALLVTFGLVRFGRRVLSLFTGGGGMA